MKLIFGVKHLSDKEKSKIREALILSDMPMVADNQTEIQVNGNSREIREALRIIDNLGS